jgi:CO/xanthine dehydrogenase Mo-binding subunit
MSLGTSLPRIDARAKVTGAANYPGDLSMPGMVHACLLFARRPHARVLAIDLADARAVPGVIEIFTGSDVPNNEYGLVLFDAPVMVAPMRDGRRLPTSAHSLPHNPEDRTLVFDGVVRHVGEKLALVVAETQEAAERARALIHVRYEDIPAIDSIAVALAPDAPQLHPHYAGNAIQRFRVRHGGDDAAIDAALSAADVVIESEYSAGAQEHAYLQPEAGLAYLDEAGRIAVQVAGQWTHEDQEQIAHALKLPIDRVRVIYPAIGGAFGGREDMSVQIVLALAAWRLNRPVKLVWTREESIIGHHKRHPMRAHARIGAMRDGRIVAARVSLFTDAGPYNYTSNKVLGNATSTCVGPYDIPHVAIDTCAVVTNNVPSGAFRGFGAPQGLFVAETQINKLAAALGMDPVALRLKNGWRDDTITAFGTPVPPGCSLTTTIRRCAEAVSEAKPMVTQAHARIGRGFASGHKNIGFSFGFPERSEATIVLHGRTTIERADVFLAGAECGQGAHTAFIQIAAQALGVPVGAINLVASDTATSGSSGSASASRLTYMTAGAIEGAAAEALQRWQDEERPARAHYVYRPRKTTSLDPVTGQGDPNITYAYVAQSADIEVDVETGHLRVLNLICADDVGRAVNPQQVVGQIEGAAIQGLGYAVLENFVTDGGYVKSAHFSTYLIPTVLDVPERMDSIIVETPDPSGAYGIRGVAELPLMIVAPAIVAAIHDATGVWIHDLPLTPERVSQALKPTARGRQERQTAR